MKLRAGPYGSHDNINYSSIFQRMLSFRVSVLWFLVIPCIFVIAVSFASDFRLRNISYFVYIFLLICIASSAVGFLVTFLLCSNNVYVLFLANRW